MKRNFSKELENTRNRLSVAMQAAMPTKEFGANIVLGMVRLHVLAKRIRESRNLEERRCLTNEFTQGRSAMEKGISTLKKNVVKEFRGKKDALRRAVS